MSRIIFNALAKPSVDAQPAPFDVLRFHERLPDYAPTPLRSAPRLAQRLGIADVLVKDESSRLGLPAFKALGASWAVYRLLVERLGREPEWRTLDELKPHVAPLLPLAVATATDGNHGRAVARVARWFGLEARIFVPRGTVQARIDAIAGEGARVEVVDGTYDDAVARAAREAGDRCLIVSDTSWPGYTQVAGWVTEGYSTILREVDDALAARGELPPDLVLAQIGVGSLAVAMITHYRHATATHSPTIVGVEPESAACALASLEAGHPVSVVTSAPTLMVGLNCGTLSMIAWPTLRDGLDATLTVDDARAADAVRALAADGIVSGETGASGAAGLIELLEGPHAAEARERLHIGPHTRALVISTEGITDPDAHARIMGQRQ